MVTATTTCPSPPRGRRRIGGDLAAAMSESWVNCVCCDNRRMHGQDKCRTCNGWGVLVVGDLRFY